MKRIITAIILVAFALVGLFGCTANNTNVSSLVEMTSEDLNAVSIEESSETELSDSEESQTENSDILEVPQDTRVSFMACPDNMVHHSVYYDAIERAAVRDGVAADYSDLHNATYDFSPIYQYIADDINNADISYINQESLIGGDSKPINAFPYFNTPVAMGHTVADLGFDVVNLAHNHALDSKNTDYLDGVEIIGSF